MINKPETRQLGTLTSADLGVWIKEPPLPKGSPLRRNHRPTRGKLESVHHFRVGDEDYTAAILRIQRSAAQVKAKEPDCREVRGPSATEVEVTDHA